MMKKLICKIIGHKRKAITYCFTWTNVEKTQCARCGTELQFLKGVSIIGEWKKFEKEMKKEGIIK